MLNDLAAGSQRADEIILKNQFDIKKGSPDYKYTCREVLKKLVERYEVEAERIEGKYERLKNLSVIQATPVHQEAHCTL